MNWLYVKHPATGGTAELPDEPGVLAWYQARGWEQADRPADRPFVPAKDGGQAPVVTDFVTLIHPETGGAHQFPDNPDAIEGAREAGWRYPEEIKVKSPAKSKTPSDTESVADKPESETV